MPRSRSPSRSPRRGDRRRDTTPMRREAPSRCSLLVRGLSKACRSSPFSPSRRFVATYSPAKLSFSCRSEDLRYEAERYGPCRDVYCPRDYYTGSVLLCPICCPSILSLWLRFLHLSSCLIVCREGRGLGFVEFTSPRDAEDAKYGMDRSILDGKEVSPT